MRLTPRSLGQRGNGDYVLMILAIVGGAAGEPIEDPRWRIKITRP